MNLLQGIHFAYMIEDIGENVNRGKGLTRDKSGSIIREKVKGVLGVERLICRGDILSANALKILGALAMLADHVGVMFFPQVELLRIVGRLAYPIFAFMIAQGCAHTRNRGRYFLRVFALAAVCQIVYYLAERSTYMSILVTFSCGIGMICALQDFKRELFSGGGDVYWAGAEFVLAVVLVWLLNWVLRIDYGFWGCMVPVFASLFQSRDTDPEWLRKLDRKEVHVAMTGLGLGLLSWSVGGIQVWCLLALPVLLLYSGKRGKWKLKYFFYIFYPAHLAILQGIAWLL